MTEPVTRTCIRPLAPTAEAVEIYRWLEEAHPGACQPDLAVALGNLGLRLGQVGRWQESLERTQETVKIYRALVETNPAEYRPDLAKSLSNLVAHLAAAGRQEEALAPAREAVEIYRPLAEAAPATHQPDFAGALREHLITVQAVVAVMSVSIRQVGVDSPVSSRAISLAIAQWIIARDLWGRAS